jgi:hypothetical protein
LARSLARHFEKSKCGWKQSEREMFYKRLGSHHFPTGFIPLILNAMDEYYQQPQAIENI